MLKQIILFFFSLLLSVSAYAVNLDVALFYQQDITSISLQATSGKYRLKGDYDHLGTYSPGVQLYIKAEDGRVLVTTADSVLGDYHAIAFRGESFMNSFRINPGNSNLSGRMYDDDLKITADGGYLKIVNHVGLEHYVAGVVQSEGGGSSKDVEFYQVQAITCRTYALNNHKKHAEEGFNLCDGVHCQVYKGKAKNSDILLAAMRTSGEVITDESKRMISASFHSNCGGQTVNSEDVWSIATPYLKSIKDTFCSDMPHAKWTYKMQKSEWLKYLENNYDYDLTEDGALDKILAFEQDQRKIFLADSIPLKKIRRDLDLKSTLFSVSVKDSMIVFNGKGFGHGVGMCQEGAINMVRKGYTYKDIIHYYYKNVKIVNYHELPYLLEEFNKKAQKQAF
ncbi:MAG: SpoIID/LytB domain-containing protein [Bacteroidota bacterium]